MEDKRILTPEDPEFYRILSNPPPFYQQIAKETGNTSLICEYDTGVLKQVSDEELEEYIWGGEFDEVEEENAAFFGDTTQEIIWH